MASSTFEGCREVTTWKRPIGDHGCKPVQIIPGLWTAHIHDLDTKELLQQIGMRWGAGVCSPAMRTRWCTVAEACGRCNAFDSFGQHTRTDQERLTALHVLQRQRCVW
jgi:hypothetical protein